MFFFSGTITDWGTMSSDEVSPEYDGQRTFLLVFLLCCSVFLCITVQATILAGYAIMWSLFAGIFSFTDTELGAGGGQHPQGALWRHFLLHLLQMS